MLIDNVVAVAVDAIVVVPMLAMLGETVERLNKLDFEYFFRNGRNKISLFGKKQILNKCLNLTSVT